VRIDLGRFYARVAQDFLNVPQAGALFKQMSGKSMAQGVDAAFAVSPPRS